MPPGASDIGGKYCRPFHRRCEQGRSALGPKHLPDRFFTDQDCVDQGCALAGVSGDPILVGSGPLSDGSANAAHLSNAAPSAAAGLFLALSSTPVPFKGGTLKPFPFFSPIFLTTNASGTINIPFAMPSGVPTGTEIWVQWGIQDGAAISGVALSNAILGLTP